MKRWNQILAVLLTALLLCTLLPYAMQAEEEIDLDMEDIEVETEGLPTEDAGLSLDVIPELESPLLELTDDGLVLDTVPAAMAGAESNDTPVQSYTVDLVTQDTDNTLPSDVGRSLLNKVNTLPSSQRQTY